MGGAAATKTGPNNASAVVWAIGEFFFSFIVVFLDANYCLLHIYYGLLHI